MDAVNDPATGVSYTGSYQSSPDVAAVFSDFPQKIQNDSGDGAGDVILTFFAKDCEGNEESITVTLNNAKMTSS